MPSPAFLLVGGVVLKAAGSDAREIVVRVVTGESRTVLIIDDDRDLRTLIALILEAEGYQVRTASDGLEGLESVRESMPGLILLDMRMPVMDGWAFAREYRTRYGSEVPIVVLTAADDARRRAEEIDASAWIGKPFDLDVLITLVGQLVKKW